MARRLPFTLRTVAAEEIAARRAVLSRFPGALGSLPLPSLAGLAGVERAAASISGIAPGDPDIARREPATWLALSAAPSPISARAALSLPTAGCRSFVDRVLGRRAHPGEVRPLSTGEQGALLFALDRAGGDWLDAGGERLVLRGFLADAEQARAYLGGPPAWTVRGAVRAGGEPLPFALCLAGAPRGAAPRGLPRDLGAVGAWQIVLRVEVGTARVSSAALAAAAPGDLLLLDEVSHPAARALGPGPILLCGRYARRCAWLDRGRLAVVSEDPRGASVEERSEPKPELTVELEPPPGDPAAGLEVSIRVELGEIRMPVERAASLAPGSVLRLDRAAGPEVGLRVGRDLVARGELVEHEGGLAVEITEVR